MNETETQVPRLAGIHHVKLPVSDLARSLAWYESRLGYKKELEFVEDGKLMGLAMAHPAGGPAFALRLDPEMAAAAAGFDYFAIHVPTREDAEALAERLSRMGEEHGGVRDTPFGCVPPLLHDPDGHEVRFYFDRNMKSWHFRRGRILTGDNRKGGDVDTTQRASLLAEVDFFKGCTQRQLDDIAKLVSSRHLDPGEVLCRQGDAESDVFVLVDGEAKVTINGQEVAVVGAGEVVGELSMETGGHRTATLTATTPLDVLVLDPREVDSVLAADPSSASNLGPRHPGPAPT